MNTQMKKEVFKMLDNDDSEPEEEVTISKKARKRRNRKKKAAQKAEGEKSNSVGRTRESSLAESATREHKLKNPLDATVAEVTEMGYNKDEVQAIVSWMWDAGLEYDNSAAVIEQLMLKQEQSTKDQDLSRESSAENLSSMTPSVPSNGNLESLAEDEDSGAEKIMKINQLELNADIGNTIKIEEEVGEDSDDDDVGVERPSETTSLTLSEMESDATPVSEPDQLSKNSPPPQVVQQHEPSQAPQELFERLEIAASHPNFGDALVALMAWTSLAGPEKMGAIFDSRALDLLFENILGKCMDYAALHGNLYGFLDRVLGQAASHPTTQFKLDLSSLLDQFYSALDQIQSINRAAPTTPDVIRLLAARFAAAIRAYRKMLSALGGGARATLQQLDGQLGQVHKRLQTQPGISGDGVRECFMRRDLQLRATTLHFQGCQALLTGTSGETLTSSLASAEESQELLKALMAQAPGTDGTNIMEQRQRVDQVRSRLKALKTECDAQIFPLQNEVNLCSEKLSDLEVRKTELLRQLKECEAETEAVVARRAALQESIASVQQTFEQEAQRADAEHVGLVSVLRFAENCENLVQSVERFETQVSHAIKSSCEISQQAQIAEINRRLAHLLVNMEAYLQTEVKCVDLMKKRIQLSENKLRHLAHEISEYKSLGMTKMADELESTSSKMRTNASEDQNCMNGIKQAVEGTYVELRGLLEGRAGGLFTLPFAPIVSIKQLLTALDLGQSWDLSTLGIIEPVGDPTPPVQQQQSPPTVQQPHLLQQVEPAAMPQTPAPIAEPVLGLDQPSSEDQTQVTSNTSSSIFTDSKKPPSQPMKMSWAAVGLVGGVAAKGKKSFLEIQKEEAEGRLTAENLKRLEQGRKPAKSPLLERIEGEIQASVSRNKKSGESENAEGGESDQGSTSKPEVTGISEAKTSTVDETLAEDSDDESEETEESLKDEAPLERRQPRRRQQEAAGDEENS